MNISSIVKYVSASLFLTMVCMWPGAVPFQSGVSFAENVDEYDPTADYPEDTTMDDPDEPTNPDDTDTPSPPTGSDSTPPAPSYPVPPSTITPGERYFREKPFTQGCGGRSTQNWGTAEQRRRNAALRARSANDIDCANDKK